MVLCGLHVLSLLSGAFCNFSLKPSEIPHVYPFVCWYHLQCSSYPWQPDTEHDTCQDRFHLNPGDEASPMEILIVDGFPLISVAKMKIYRSNKQEVVTVVINKRWTSLT